MEGAGPTFVILPSYGRDGGANYDGLTVRLTEAVWRVLRLQPRGRRGLQRPDARCDIPRSCPLMLPWSSGNSAGIHAVVAVNGYVDGGYVTASR